MWLWFLTIYQVHPYQEAQNDRDRKDDSQCSNRASSQDNVGYCKSAEDEDVQGNSLNPSPPGSRFSYPGKNHVPGPPEGQQEVASCYYDDLLDKCVGKTIKLHKGAVIEMNEIGQETECLEEKPIIVYRFRSAQKDKEAQGRYEKNRSHPDRKPGTGQVQVLGLLSREKGQDNQDAKWNVGIGKLTKRYLF